MKLRAPLLALAVALLISAPQAQADNKKPAVLGSASKVISDESWDDAIYEDEAPAPDAPSVPPAQSMSPGQSMSPSDAEPVPPPGGSTNPLRGTGTITRHPVRTVPAWTKTPALDEAYEGIIDDTVGLVLNPDCPHLSRDCGCLPPPWAHRSSVFGEYLFLRPRSTDANFAMPIATGDISSSTIIPHGALGTIDPNYSSGFRTGINRAIDQCASIRGVYTYYQNSASGGITAGPGTRLVPLLDYAGLPSPNLPLNSAQGSSSLNFQMADVELRKLFAYDQHYALNYTIGARYLHLSGDLGAHYTGLRGISRQVSADSNFDGGGIRFGLDGDHYARRTGLLAYWRGGASFIGGQFRTNYSDTINLETLSVNSHWNGGRLVSILDAEIGVGWSSKSQRMRVRAGYLIMGWFNTVGPGTYVNAVQTGNYGHMSKAFSLDGLTASAEWRF